MKGMIGRVFLGVVLVLLFGGCVDIVQPPPAVEIGTVTVRVSGGAERTVAPRVDQFGKIVLGIAGRDGTADLEDVDASAGDAEVSFPVYGSWRITAKAYLNAADQEPAAASEPHDFSWDGTGIIGDTLFILVPGDKTAPGTLQYTVILPDAIALAASGSRITIEQDGAAPAGLEDDDFNAGIHGISASETDQSVGLAAGRYAVEILLVRDDGRIAAFRTGVVILPALVTKIAFTPDPVDFLDPAAHAAQTRTGGTFQRTQNNSSYTTIGALGGSGPNKTLNLHVPHDTGQVFFVLNKGGSGRTVTLSGPGAEKVVQAPDEAWVDGTQASSSSAVFTVDTQDIAELGGTLGFTLSLADPGKMPVVYAVTVILPVLTGIKIDTAPEKEVYRKGEPLDLTGIKLTGTWDDRAKDEIIPGEADIINGFDSDQAGKQTISITISKYGITTNNTFTITVVDILSESELFFECGWNNHLDPKPNRFSVVLGRTLTLAPVKWFIPDDAVYEWKVNGQVQGSVTEYLSLSPPSLGEYTVTVTAKAGGLALAAAETTVECVQGPLFRQAAEESSAGSVKLYAYIAPGQFGEYYQSGVYGAGGYGGYTVFAFDHSVARRGVNGEELLLGGNAFTNWSEPGIIWVMQDENRNGLPDDTWYELTGSHDSLAVRRHSVKFLLDERVWFDNHGGDGTMRRYSVLLHPYSRTVYTGTMLPNSLNTISGLWGYADVVDNGRVSLSNAVQMDGTPITLDFIDFVKVQTAINYDGDLFGERSTETGLPRDRFMPNPDLLLTGSGPNNGLYSYAFANNSGYDLTIEFQGEEFPLLRNSGAAVKTSPNPSEYIDFYGGNVTLTRGTGTAVFTDS
jgi:hypothetical protein